MMYRSGLLGFGVIVLILATFGGCGKKVQQATEGNPINLTANLKDTAGIESALELLLGQKEQQPFLIIEEPTSGKFVQFFGSRKEDLILDLPSQPLDQDALQRAKTFFAAKGVVPIDQGGKGRFGQELVVFQADLGRDCKKAVEWIVTIFKEIYQLPSDTDLTLTIDIGV